MTEPTPTPPPPASEKPTNTASKRAPLIFAFVIIVVGLWLLAEAMGYSVPRLSKIWPIFLAIGGIASLLDYLTISKKPRSAGQAVFGITASIVCFAFVAGGSV